MTNLLIAGAMLVTAAHGTYSLFARRTLNGMLSFGACACLAITLFLL